MSLNPEEAEAVIAHMNEDHSDAVLIYAQVYGHLGEAESATMLSMTETHMDLQSDKGSVRIYFETPIPSREASRSALVELLKRARAGLDIPQLRFEKIKTPPSS